MIKEQLRKIETGIVIKQDILEKQVKIVYLAVGSNLGNRINYINNAKIKLENQNIKIVQCSSFYESLSWPNIKNPKFINIVVKIKTVLSPEDLLKKCKQIENQLGRIRVYKNQPRTCDIDIIDYDSMILKSVKTNHLNLPHPEVSNRNFVLLPLYEISKTWRHPKTKIKISKLINLLKVEDLMTIKQV